MIRVSNLHKKFGKLHVLRGIDEHIRKGEVVVVIGPSGSGKSTFLRCLNLLEYPTEGEIIFEGVSITDPKNDINQLRQKMGMVFQQFNLFPHMNVLKNITLAPSRLKKMTEEEAEEVALDLLKAVGLLDKAEAYPNQLSGGQDKVAIARRSHVSGGYIVCEPTSALDRSCRRSAGGNGRIGCSRMTMIVVTHEMRFAKRLERESSLWMREKLLSKEPPNKSFPILSIQGRKIF